MKANTAAIGVKDGICQKMVYINENRRKQYQDDNSSIFFKEEKTNEYGQNEMDAIVEQKSKHL